MGNRIGSLSIERIITAVGLLNSPGVAITEEQRTRKIYHYQDGKLHGAALARMHDSLHLFGVSNNANNGIDAAAMMECTRLNAFGCLPY